MKSNIVAPLNFRSVSIRFRGTYAVLIVDVGDFRHVQRLPSVEVLLVLQYPLVEELLELLVAIVYAELLETVDFEVLYENESKSVASSLVAANLGNEQPDRN